MAGAEETLSSKDEEHLLQRDHGAFLAYVIAEMFPRMVI